MEKLLQNARNLGKETHHVVAAAALMGNEQTISLCVWCAETLAPEESYIAHRLPRGGECSACSNAGRDVLVFEAL